MSKSVWIIIAICAGIAVIGGAALFGALWWDVQSAVSESADAAMESHPAEDRVEALIAVMNDESLSFDERNNAVWALGQLKDPRALPALEANLTGLPCDHDKYICQYELKKAIAKCEGTYRWNTKIEVD